MLLPNGRDGYFDKKFKFSGTNCHNRTVTRVQGKTEKSRSVPTYEAAGAEGGGGMGGVFSVKGKITFEW